MAPAKPLVVPSTDKTSNRMVDVTGALSIDEMEAVLIELGSALGLHVSHITTLGTKRYPGNRHWHLKRDDVKQGCLDVTYWPSGPAMWISMRHYEPEWVHEFGKRLGAEFERRFATP